MQDPKKNKAAAQLSKLSWRGLDAEQRTIRTANGAKAGGRAAALAMTPEQRAERARKGALARAANYAKKREAAALAAKEAK